MVEIYCWVSEIAGSTSLWTTGVPHGLDKLHVRVTILVLSGPVKGD